MSKPLFYTSAATAMFSVYALLHVAVLNTEKEYEFEPLITHANKPDNSEFEEEEDDEEEERGSLAESILSHIDENGDWNLSDEEVMSLQNMRNPFDSPQEVVQTFEQERQRIVERRRQEEIAEEAEDTINADDLETSLVNDILEENGLDAREEDEEEEEV